jgi:hypothetical protein
LLGFDILHGLSAVGIHGLNAVEDVNWTSTIPFVQAIWRTAWKNIFYIGNENFDLC